jgi:hypothetical protein
MASISADERSWIGVEVCTGNGDWRTCRLRCRCFATCRQALPAPGGVGDDSGWRVPSADLASGLFALSCGLGVMNQGLVGGLLSTQARRSGRSLSTGRVGAHRDQTFVDAIKRSDQFT